jgi:hypothetical protein
MIYHKTWNPWIRENGSLRRTSETTFFRPLTYTINKGTILRWQSVQAAPQGI